jgi:hypothetical protein
MDTSQFENSANQEETGFLGDPNLEIIGVIALIDSA